MKKCSNMNKNIGIWQSLKKEGKDFLLRMNTNSDIISIAYPVMLMICVMLYVRQYLTMYSYRLPKDTHEVSGRAILNKEYVIRNDATHKAVPLISFLMKR